MRLVKYLLYKRLIRPILQSKGSIRQVSWGVAIGVFFALTPTVGIQMYTVALIWTLSRYILGIQFNLPVAVAMVWISNPLTMVPLYYLFLISGYAALGTEVNLSFAHFDSQLSSISAMENTWDSIVKSTRFLLIDLGWPMVIGGFLYAIPGSLMSYWLTFTLLSRYRQLRLQKRLFIKNGIRAIENR